MSNVFDEMRANRTQRADSRRADADAAHQRQLAAQAAQAEQERTDRDRREARKAARAETRRQHLDTARRWVTTHPVDVLTSVIIVVPALLAWTAMASYGQQLYGPHGTLLPLFTEAAMWAFAFRLQQTRRATPPQPTGWLQFGTWAFTAVAALLNFTHGYDLGGVGVGLVMATVSTGGVLAHQILTAAPMRTRRTRAEKRAARTHRVATRRATRMERAALRRAVGELATDGTVRLLHQPGTVTLVRAWTGRRHLTTTTISGLGADGPTAGEAVADTLGAEVQAWLASQPSPQDESPPTTAPSTLDTVETDDGADQHRDRAGQPRPEAPATEPARRSIDHLRTQLREAVQAGAVDPASAESIRKTLRVGRQRAKQLRDEWNDGTGVTA